MLSRALLLILTAGGLSDAADPLGMTFNFSTETPGAASTSAPALVGQWCIAVDGDNRALKVDGQQWRHEQLPATLSTTATLLFPDSGAAFIERIRARP